MREKKSTLQGPTLPSAGRVTERSEVGWVHLSYKAHMRLTDKRYTGQMTISISERLSLGNTATAVRGQIDS